LDESNEKAKAKGRQSFECLAEDGADFEFIQK